MPVERITRTVTLAPGASAVVSFSVTPTVAGVHNITVDGLSGSFTATPVAAPADIVLSGLVISPATVVVGGTVTISVTATNRGGTAGSKTIELVILY